MDEIIKDHKPPPPLPKILATTNTGGFSFVGLHVLDSQHVCIGVVEDAEILTRLAQNLMDWLGMGDGGQILGTILIWHRPGEKFHLRSKTPLLLTPTASVWVHESSQLLLSFDDGSVQVFTFDDALTSCTRTYEFKAHRAHIRTIAYDYRHDWLFSASDDRCLRVHSIRNQSAEVINGRECGKAQPSALQYDDECGLLFVANWSEEILIFDAKSKPPVQVHALSGHSGSVRTLSWDRTTRRLYSGSFDKNICAWKVEAQASKVHCQQLGRMSGHDSTIVVTKCEPSSQLLFSGDYAGYVFVWDTRAYVSLRYWVAHDGEVRCLHWSPQERTLTSSAADETIKVWELTDLAKASAAETNPEGRGVALLSTLSLNDAEGDGYPDLRALQPKEPVARAPTRITNHRVGGGGYGSMQDDALSWDQSSAVLDGEAKEYI